MKLFWLLKDTEIVRILLNGGGIRGNFNAFNSGPTHSANIIVIDMTLAESKSKWKDASWNKNCKTIWGTWLIYISITFFYIHSSHHVNKGITVCIGNIYYIESIFLNWNHFFIYRSDHITSLADSSYTI